MLLYLQLFLGTLYLGNLLSWEKGGSLTVLKIRSNSASKWTADKKIHSKQASYLPAILVRTAIYWPIDVYCSLRICNWFLFILRSGLSCLAVTCEMFKIYSAGTLFLWILRYFETITNATFSGILHKWGVLGNFLCSGLVVLESGYHRQCNRNLWFRTRLSPCTLNLLKILC